MDGLRIGPWMKSDGITLDKVLDETDALTGQFRPQQGPPTADPFRISFVARDDSGPVGLATAFESRWHPQRLWVSVEVAPSHRRQGIGSALLGAVRAASGRRPLRAKVFAGGAAAGFAAAHGFRVIQRSRTVQLDGALPPTPEMSVEIDGAPDAVAAALLDIYVRTHAWDPPGDIDVDDVLAVHAADAAVTLMVRDATGVVLAAAGLYDEEEGLELSGGATTEAGTLARPAVGALLDTATAHAATQGRPLLVEVDDSNTELVAETTARHAVPVDEIHIVVDDRPAGASLEHEQRQSREPSRVRHVGPERRLPVHPLRRGLPMHGGGQHPVRRWPAYQAVPSGLRIVLWSRNSDIRRLVTTEQLRTGRGRGGGRRVAGPRR